MIQARLLDQLVQEADWEGIRQLVVGAVIVHNGRVLLLRRPDTDFMGNIWELPSGKVESGEPLDTALFREIEEETGLDATNLRHYLGAFDYLSGSGKRSRQFNFVVDIVEPEPVTLTEHDAYVWSDLAEDPPVTDAVKEVLEHFRSIEPAG
ncbi:DNA mismatch repair protein MutT [Nocardia donostiensis]|uniref:NUDIX domain-containing protein n=1 Tax=Nocardia donostiensis TaxID=1538463 RepID=UPI0009DB0190|nr:NUDIX domain-containing protein [Nocardia donostiensis]OQS13936.1 DNA mismatch repair protein MutT [Nocardia donostiensis]